MSIAAAIRKLIESGLTLEHALLAAEVMEAALSVPTSAETMPSKSPAALRQQRYRERKASQTVTDHNDVTPVTLVTSQHNNVTHIRNGVTLFDPPGLDKEIPPIPPKEINPTPKTHTVRKRSGKPNAAPAYPAEFNLLWGEFAFHPNASKKDAFAAWDKLPEEDRDKCFDGAMAYGRFLETERQRRPDYPALHLSTFINQRRFDSLLEARR